MILSLLKILIFVAAVAGLAWGANWLLGVEGFAVINVANHEITLDVLQMVIAALVVIAAVWVLLKLLSFTVALLRFLNGDNTAISRFFSASREKRGFRALTDGMMALAAGDGTEALAQARRADRLLKKPQLTNLLTAQAAEAAGDSRTAEETYKRLLESDKTRFVGIRGIMKQKLAAGDTDTAMKLAEKAFALKPRHGETQDVLLRLQAERADWAGARETLNAQLRSGAIPRDLHRRRDAVLALSQARDSDDQDTIIEANRLSPDLIPAAVLTAQGYVTAGNPKAATRVLKKAWEAQPHPELAAAYAAIAPEETPQERIKRFGALVRPTPDHPETKMLLAELHIAAEDFPGARRALGDLPEQDPTTRSLTIMAAIERGEGAEDAVVRGWLTRALAAPRGPQWVCDKCQAVHAQWSPVCDSCGALDSLTWRRPNSAEVAMPSSTELLPLMTGPKDTAGEIAVIDAEVTPEDEAPEQSPEDESQEPPKQD